MSNNTIQISSTPVTKQCTNELSIDLLSQAFKACGDVLRLQILQVLQHDIFGVLELTQIFDTKQSGMSHHLKVLSQSGLVEAQREGNAVFYRRPMTFDSTDIQSTTETIYSLVDLLPLDEVLSDRILDIQVQRAAQSQAFFSRNADRFQEHQELIAKHSLYAEASLEMLLQGQENREPSLSEQTIIEVGPGEGHFLTPLSKTYKSVIAIDNSRDMLNKAREFALQEGLNNIKFELCDTQSYKQYCIQGKRELVDVVVMNMVLHHVPAPAQIFSDLSCILRPGGTFVLCDLAHHNQEWTRESCGDHWLGFQAHELINWANRAGFTEEKNAFIGLRNGFQIQLRKFVKSTKTSIN
jgi:ArsR family transcriptional regulator